MKNTSIILVQSGSFFVYEYNQLSTILLRRIDHVQDDKAHYHQYEFEFGKHVRTGMRQVCRRRQIINWATRIATDEDIALLEKINWQLDPELQMLAAFRNKLLFLKQEGEG